MRTLLLILPVLLPSWRFFKAIEPSPRVQWAWVSTSSTGPWQAFWPRPERLTLLQVIRRLVWNPEANEALFVTSCAERIAQGEAPHSIAEITSRIVADVAPKAGCLRFRLVFVSREGAELVEEVVFTSDIITVPA